MLRRTPARTPRPQPCSRRQGYIGFEQDATTGYNIGAARDGCNAALRGQHGSLDVPGGVHDQTDGLRATRVDWIGARGPRGSDRSAALKLDPMPDRIGRASRRARFDLTPDAVPVHVDHVESGLGNVRLGVPVEVWAKQRTRQRGEEVGKPRADGARRSDVFEQQDEAVGFDNPSKPSTTLPRSTGALGVPASALTTAARPYRARGPARSGRRATLATADDRQV